MAWGLIVHEIWGEGGEVVENVVLIMLHAIQEDGNATPCHVILQGRMGDYGWNGGGAEIIWCDFMIRQ